MHVHVLTGIHHHMRETIVCCSCPCTCVLCWWVLLSECGCKIGVREKSRHFLKSTIVLCSVLSSSFPSGAMPTQLQWYRRKLSVVEFVTSPSISDICISLPILPAVNGRQAALLLISFLRRPSGRLQVMSFTPNDTSICIADLPRGTYSFWSRALSRPTYLQSPVLAIPVRGLCKYQYVTCRPHGGWVGGNTACEYLTNINPLDTTQFMYLYFIEFKCLSVCLCLLD